jgi:hypothetical protein
VIVELRSVPDCPNLAPVRQVLYAALADLGLPPEVTELVGDYPSPSVLINGVDVMGRSAARAASPACRLDLPTGERVRLALRHALASETGSAPLIEPPASGDRLPGGYAGSDLGEDRLVDRFLHASGEEPGDEPVRVEAE